ncbi:MAG: SemiSWEET family transporter [Candidatus Omnitrophica bacterium]|nr:SemiSWEET family transporter [Candidatus Omnitrophota bacterium]MDD5552653.1 SemiSWEET family transporter [Candidatus Omnitrophota bacterium]
MVWKIIGMSAAVLTMFSFVPQIITILKHKSAKDVSIVTLLQLSLGVSLWIVYGLFLNDKIIITANAVTLTTLAISLYLYFKYKNG